MKKIVSMLVVLSMLSSFCAMSVSASSAWSKGEKDIQHSLGRRNGIPYGLAKKAFEDVDLLDWAQKAIEMLCSKGLVRGYGNGLFKPRGKVTKLETIIMTLRIMGWEDKALNMKELTPKYRGNYVGSWAVGYINMAYEKGILDDVDMMYFEPGAPALRHEVAKYVIRALGYEEKAQENMDSELPFDDAALVPVGSIGYVYLINELDLMKGYNRRFNPLGTLTRAEMAVLFQRLDRKVDKIDEAEFRGIVYKIDEDSIKVRVKGELKTFDVSEDVIVYDRDSRIPYGDITVGSMVIIGIKDDVVTYIELIDEDDDEDKIITVYSGKIIGIKNAEPRQITLQDKELKLIFNVIDDVDVYINGDESDFNELRIGDNVKIVVDRDNRARKIKIEREEDQETDKVNGYITSLDLKGIYHITVSDAVYGGTRYRLDRDAVVIIDGDEEELEDLVVGMYAEAELLRNIVTKITARNVEFQFEGKIIGVVNNLITIEKDNNTRVTFILSEDVSVLINGNSDNDIYDLSPGDKAEFEVINNTVHEIEIETQ